MSEAERESCTAGKEGACGQTVGVLTAHRQWQANLCANGSTRAGMEHRGEEDGTGESDVVGSAQLMSQAEPGLVMSRFVSLAQLKMAQLGWLSRFEPSHGNTKDDLDDNDAHTDIGNGSDDPLDVTMSPQMTHTRGWWNCSEI
ncbi:hypothetical protein EDB86DRAFT_3248898 [Lactarius hatsudake]|nr:hypothetical protein EDB86DRAFT_3248898 [Lactarius hatsudake]